MNLYYLIYSSTHAQVFTTGDIEKLLKDARKNNTLHGVTGMLICLPNSFIQLIEGPISTVKQLYANIEKDKRHRNVMILKSGFSGSRYFPDWSMGVDLDLFNPEDSNDLFHFCDDKIFELLNILDMQDL